jgi:Helix-turn-helix domain
MFEIGSSLREARERRNLGYGQVEADTAIRTRYIRALEDEDFHILPGPTYTKGFLRAYAEYLGLDGQPFVDEFNSRHHDPRAAAEHTPIASRPRSQPRQRRRHRRESNLVMIALAAIVAVSFLVVLALRFPPRTATYNTNTGSTSSTHRSGATTAGVTTAPPAGGGTASTGGGTAPAAGRFQVVLTLSGSTWVLATAGSPHGPGVIARGGIDLGGSGIVVDSAAHPTVVFTSRKPVFLALGAPGNVTATVNGHAVTLPHVAAGARIRLDAHGVHAA